MPKEMISTPFDGEKLRVSVGWAREGGVQLGVHVQDSSQSLIDVLYPTSQYAVDLGDRLYRWFASQEPLEDLEETLADADACFDAGAMLLGWVDEARFKVDRDGLWAHLARSSINELIRTLRKARDVAYGRDE